MDHQGSVGFPRQGQRTVLPFPPPGDLPTQGSNLHLLRWQAGSSPLSHQRNPSKSYILHLCNICEMTVILEPEDRFLAAWDL